MVEVEQAIHLRTMDAELAREIGLARSRFRHRAIERELGSDNGRQGDNTLSPLGARGKWNLLAVGDAALQSGRNGIGRSEKRIGKIISKGCDFRQVGRGDEQGAVVVLGELYGI